MYFPEYLKAYALQQFYIDTLASWMILISTSPFSNTQRS